MHWLGQSGKRDLYGHPMYSCILNYHSYLDVYWFCVYFYCVDTINVLVFLYFHFLPTGGPNLLLEAQSGTFLSNGCCGQLDHLTNNLGTVSYRNRLRTLWYLNYLWIVSVLCLVSTLGAQRNSYHSSHQWRGATTAHPSWICHSEQCCPQEMGQTYVLVSIILLRKVRPSGMMFAANERRPMSDRSSRFVHDILVNHRINFAFIWASLSGSSVLMWQ